MNHSSSSDGFPVREDSEGMIAAFRPNEEPTAPNIPPLYIRTLASLTVYSELRAASILERFCASADEVKTGMGVQRRFRKSIYS